MFKKLGVDDTDLLEIKGDEELSGDEKEMFMEIYTKISFALKNILSQLPISSSEVENKSSDETFALLRSAESNLGLLHQLDAV